MMYSPVLTIASYTATQSSALDRPVLRACHGRVGICSPQKQILGEFVQALSTGHATMQAFWRPVFWLIMICTPFCDPVKLVLAKIAMSFNLLCRGFEPQCPLHAQQSDSDDPTQDLEAQ